MTQVLLQRFNIVSSTETVDGVSMAKVVESKIGIAQFLHNSLEILVKHLVVDVTTKLCGEYQIVRI